MWKRTGRSTTRSPGTRFVADAPAVAVHPGRSAITALSASPVSLPQFGERPERLADRGRLVPELPFAGTRGFAIRSADGPVVGLHHRVGEKQLPQRGGLLSVAATTGLDKSCGRQYPSKDCSF